MCQNGGNTAIPFGHHMQKLISELTRLYLPAGLPPPDGWQQRLQGEMSASISLVSDDGLTRAIVIAFRKLRDAEEAQHWTLLCEVANALQAQYGFPAPAVSISGADGYQLWLSLEMPVQTALVATFIELLRAKHFPVVETDAADDIAVVELPPCQNLRTGKWAAFINPGLGASFADESGLEMAPPLAGQAALLEGLHSISEAQFLNTMQALTQSHASTPLPVEPGPRSVQAPDGLLLTDATLEDIVRHLHSKHIEPTFRHLIK